MARDEERKGGMRGRWGRDGGFPVPTALPRAVRILGELRSPARIDRVWLFPPVVSGRKEQGVLVASLLLEGEEERRGVVTLHWTHEVRSGGALDFTHLLRDEGIVPADRMHRVIEGVVRRSGDFGAGGAEERIVAGEVELFERWIVDVEERALRVERQEGRA